ncbi:DUF1127 domain-containing protein [Aquamicrobium ahrensii]|uniref:Uncharacterized protein YjiS (DUF1127 family) n=1 Tax=Aquamicrobium ahrensii TaxID=469551 RepID=A0ABV2KKR3_9HYPH
MTACDCAAPVSRISVRPSALARLGLDVRRLLTLWRNRRAFNRLCEMTEAELADIGVSRSDLHDALEVRFAGDPTARLRAIADARATIVAGPL